MVHEPLTKLQCCPTSDGSAAAILASEEFVRSHGLEDQAVEILGMSMKTDFPSSFDSGSDMKFVGFDMTKTAAQEVYEQSGFGPARRRRHRAARLLLGQRDGHLRGARPLR